MPAVSETTNITEHFGTFTSSSTGVGGGGPGSQIFGPDCHPTIVPSELQKSLMADEYGIFGVILTSNSQHLAAKARNLTSVTRYKVVKFTLQTLSDDMIITLSTTCLYFVITFVITTQKNEYLVTSKM